MPIEHLFHQAVQATTAANNTSTSNTDNTTSSNTNMCEFILPNEYGYVIIGAALVAFLCILQGFVMIGSRRKRIFNKQFMAQFTEEHNKYFASDVTTTMGYPDMGNGIYAKKLPYNEWREFNQAQRVHHHFLEGIAQYIFFILATGLYFPMVAVGLSVLVIASRIAYASYVSDEGAWNKIRLFGSTGSMVALLVGFIFTVINGLKISCILEQ